MLRHERHEVPQISLGLYEGHVCTILYSGHGASIFTTGASWGTMLMVIRGEISQPLSLQVETHYKSDNKSQMLQRIHEMEH